MKSGIFGTNIYKNNIYTILTSLNRIGKNAIEFATKGDSYGRMFSLVPALAKFFPGISGYKVIRKASVELYKTAESLVMEQWRTFQVNIDRHYLDIYFNQLKKDQNNSEKSSFTRNNIKITDFDYFEN